eukprot:761110-Prymnesium_polylepis.1
MKRYDTPIRTKKKGYLVRGVHTWRAIIYTDGDTAAVARENTTQREFQLRQFEVIKAHTWNGKWAGPEGASYASDVKWDYYGMKKLSELTNQSVYTRHLRFVGFTSTGGFVGFGDRFTSGLAVSSH